VGLPTLRIVCQQLAPRIADLEFNRAQTVRAIKDAVEAGGQVVVLPELATSGYVFEAREEAASVAITPDDAVFEEWAAAAARGDAVVIGGFCEHGGDGLLYNSAAVVDGSGVLGVYRKVHLWDREKLVFEPGSAPPRVFETRHGRIGVVVCYDLEFPEMPRMLALAGAELIAVPTNWPLAERPPDERPGEVINAMAAARLNRVFIACCDRTGRERGQEWTAGTSIVDHNGWVLAAQADEGTAIADVDLALANDKRFTGLADALADRRPDLYRAVLQGAPTRVSARAPASAPSAAAASTESPRPSPSVNAAANESPQP
jgi:predicted amidohydrolase